MVKNSGVQARLCRWVAVGALKILVSGLGQLRGATDFARRQWDCKRGNCRSINSEVVRLEIVLAPGQVGRRAAAEIVEINKNRALVQ
jgi:hypothetical protein